MQAQYLADKGLADPAKLCITGGSAGGYTTLACLAFRCDCQNVHAWIHMLLLTSCCAVSKELLAAVLLVAFLFCNFCKYLCPPFASSLLALRAPALIWQRLTTELCFESRQVFSAGASHYGVADLQLLAAETHKFESRCAS